MPSPIVYTVADVAELMHVHVATVRRWITAGDLVAVRLGARAVRIRDEDLRRFLDSRPHVTGED